MLESSRLRAALVCGVLTVVGSAGFAALRSNDFTRVDGATLPLRVFLQREAPVAVANHALEHKVSAAWEQVVSRAYGPAGDPATFLRRRALLNAVSAGLALGGLVWLVWRSSGSLAAGVVAGALAGSTHAFVLHATHSTQPMVAIALAVFALLLALESEGRRGAIARVGAGFLLGLGSLVYLPVLLAVAALIMAGWSLRDGGRAREGWRSVGLICMGMCGSALVALPALLELGSRSLQGEPDPTVHFGSWWSYWLSPSLSGVSQLPLALAANIWTVLPRRFAGLRSLPELLSSVQFGLLIVAVTTAVTISLLMAIRWLGRQIAGVGSSRLDLVGAALFLPGVAGPFLVSVYYDKLWLLPILGLSIALAAAVCSKGGGWSVSAARVAVVAWLVLSVSTWVEAHGRATRDTPHLRESEEIAEIVGPNSLVILDWSPVSVLYSSFWAGREGREVFDFPAELTMQREATATALRERIEIAWAQGKTVWALNVLGDTRAILDTELLERAGAPHESFAWFERSAAAPGATLTGMGTARLWKLDAASPNRND